MGKNTLLTKNYKKNDTSFVAYLVGKPTTAMADFTGNANTE
ncbi:hypothetical protein M23134_05690 [Microscilla marina ATCC 23134]|uniref:Uncharacterized protein n=1 Tax=Microscilla marina ATCC 23134 TaxID=313606 RepID=A1ZIE9_MICM2|nr:hypothetical protein M23134_05690 [Microscilla marina ATCC 23134]